MPSLSSSSSVPGVDAEAKSATRRSRMKKARGGAEEDPDVGGGEWNNEIASAVGGATAPGSTAGKCPMGGGRVPPSIRFQRSHDGFTDHSLLSVFPRDATASQRSDGDTNNDSASFTGGGGNSASALWSGSTSPNPPICSGIETLPIGMQELSLNFHKFTSVGIMILVDFLEADRGQKYPVTSLELLNNELNDDAAGAVGILLSSEVLRKRPCGPVVKLKLGGNHFTSVGMKALAPAIRSVRCSLLQLHVGGNPIGDEGVKLLAEALNPEGGCNLGDEEVSAVEESSATNGGNPSSTPPADLVASSAGGHKEAGEGASGAVQYSAMEVLCLCTISTTEACLPHVASILHSCPKLWSLQMKSSPIDTTTMMNFGEQLMEVSSGRYAYGIGTAAGTMGAGNQEGGVSTAVSPVTVEPMTFPSTNHDGATTGSTRHHMIITPPVTLSTIGAAGLIPPLIPPTLRPVPFSSQHAVYSLTVLSLNSCNIDAESCAAFCQFVTTAPRVKPTSLNGPDDVVVRMPPSPTATLLPFLSSLDLSNNPIGDFGVKSLCRWLSIPDDTTNRLSCIYLAATGITKLGVQWLSEAIRTSPRLSMLDLSSNTLTDAGDAIAALLLAERVFGNYVDPSSVSTAGAGTAAMSSNSVNPPQSLMSAAAASGGPSTASASKLRKGGWVPPPSSSVHQRSAAAMAVVPASNSTNELMPLEEASTTSTTVSSAVARCPITGKCGGNKNGGTVDEDLMSTSTNTTAKKSGVRSATVNGTVNGAQDATPTSTNGRPIHRHLVTLWLQHCLISAAGTKLICEALKKTIASSQPVSVLDNNGASPTTTTKSATPAMTISRLSHLHYGGNFSGGIPAQDSWPGVILVNPYLERLFLTDNDMSEQETNDIVVATISAIQSFVQGTGKSALQHLRCGGQSSVPPKANVITNPQRSALSQAFRERNAKVSGTITMPSEATASNTTNAVVPSSTGAADVGSSSKPPLSSLPVVSPTAATGPSIHAAPLGGGSMNPTAVRPQTITGGTSYTDPTQFARGVLPPPRRLSVSPNQPPPGAGMMCPVYAVGTVVPGQSDGVSYNATIPSVVPNHRIGAFGEPLLVDAAPTPNGLSAAACPWQTPTPPAYVAPTMVVSNVVASGGAGNPFFPVMAFTAAYPAPPPSSPWSVGPTDMP